MITSKNPTNFSGGSVKNSGTIIEKCIIKNEHIPYSKVVCATCGEWKPLISLGYEREETWLCETCIKKNKNYKIKGSE